MTDGLTLIVLGLQALVLSASALLLARTRRAALCAVRSQISAAVSAERAGRTADRLAAMLPPDVIPFPFPDLAPPAQTEPRAESVRAASEPVRPDDDTPAPAANTAPLRIYEPEDFDRYERAE